ncbi:hypothetical protein [Paenibacillus sp. 481]|uniref:hypothetical protein n=1 Tax=Paenibacillus sp. 481 TaxID=2835869 RepID=UPI001E4BA466|nr:hypothetical protein [Paenibacillus sp. 481]UHA74416.1 hypothetical protein KIK04_04725 [Paenibacillus sp. 481]
MESLNWIKNKYLGLISFVERHSDKIPFSKFIIMYLKIPFMIRLFFTLLVLGISHGITYTIGFIILQSKARNEVLSLITAFHNPVLFIDRLYFYYAFVYIFIMIITFLPLVICILFGKFFVSKLNKSISNKLARYTVFLISGTLMICASFLFFQVAPMLPFLLFYASKYSSLWDVFVNYMMYSIELPWIAPVYDLTDFQKEVFVSLQSGNLTAIILFILFFSFKYLYKSHQEEHLNILKLALSELALMRSINNKLDILKTSSLIMFLRFKKMISEISYTLFLLFFILAVTTIFVTHTPYQLGSFGKNLAQFDTDYVTVNYNFNGQVKKIEGIRVYQDKNYMVIRDNKNVIHHIYADQIHMQTEQLQKSAQAASGT